MVLLLLLSVTHLVNVSTSYTVSYTPRESERGSKREKEKRVHEQEKRREPDVDIRYLYETAALSRSKQKIIKENVNLTTT